jgi:NitT/TauT family transport system permease protein
MSSSAQKIPSYAVETPARAATQAPRTLASTTRRGFFRTVVLPFTGIAAGLLLWQIAVWQSSASLIPGPIAVARAIGELAMRGLLLKYVVASLFRVSWGYSLALVVALFLGLFLGVSRRAELTMNPFLQLLRPISPLAWIPIAILWFGVGDISAIFLIFLASLLPLTVATMNAVRNIDPVHLSAARNFDLPVRQRVTKVLLPAILPQLIVAMRIALGVAWLVVVAAEMIAVNSGLGFLIVDARNAGNRYDLVIAGMALIGLIGLALDLLMRRLERLRSVRWGYAANT